MVKTYRINLKSYLGIGVAVYISGNLLNFIHSLGVCEAV